MTQFWYSDDWEVGDGDDDSTTQTPEVSHSLVRFPNSLWQERLWNLTSEAPTLLLFGSGGLSGSSGFGSKGCWSLFWTQGERGKSSKNQVRFPNSNKCLYVLQWRVGWGTWQHDPDQCLPGSWCQNYDTTGCKAGQDDHDSNSGNVVAIVVKVWNSGYRGNCDIVVKVWKTVKGEPTPLPRTLGCLHKKVEMVIFNQTDFRNGCSTDLYPDSRCVGVLAIYPNAIYPN